MRSYVSKETGSLVVVLIWPFRCVSTDVLISSPPCDVVAICNRFPSARTQTNQPFELGNACNNADVVVPSKNFVIIGARRRSEAITNEAKEGTRRICSSQFCSQRLFILKFPPIFADWIRDFFATVRRRSLDLPRSYWVSNSAESIFLHDIQRSWL